jgi:flagellar FliL protein
MKLKKKAEGDAPAEGKSGKGNLVPAIVVAVGLLGGGYFFAGKSSAPAAEAAPVEVPEAVHEEEGPVVPIDPITVNLSDGHYLKVGLALQLAPAEEGDGGGHGGSEEAMAEGDTAKALDQAIDVLGHHSMEELSDPAQRAAVKETLAETIREAYHGEVTDLYFTEFVMQ